MLFGSGTLWGMQSERREWLNPPWDCGQSRKPRLSEFENLPKTLWHTKLLCCSNPVKARPQFSKPDWPRSQIPSRKSQQSNQPLLANQSVHPVRWQMTMTVFVIVEYHKPDWKMYSWVSSTRMYERAMEWHWHTQVTTTPRSRMRLRRNLLSWVKHCRRCSPTYILERGRSEKTSQSCPARAIYFN